MNDTPLRLGTRGSRLALWQAHYVADTIRTRLERPVELVILKTQGDRDQSRPVTELGGVGVFVKELERALLDDEIDLAVHSLKDLPTELPDGLRVPAYPVRKSPHECLIVHPDALDPARAPFPLVEGARVGTASLRRRALLLERRPDLSVAGIRGNVPTRVDKVRAREVDAVMLAAAGIDRLELDLSGLERRDLALDDALPAPGQGALAIEVRAADAELCALLARLDDLDARRATGAERELLALIGAGCSVPLGARAWPVGGELVLVAALQTNRPDAAFPVLRRARVRAATPEDAAALALRALAPPARDGAVQDGAALELAGQRVLVAREPERAEELVTAIRDAGGEARCRAACERVTLADPAAARAALAPLGPEDWALFASANAVEALAAALAPTPLSAALSGRVGAIGAATARALGAHGLAVDLLPARASGAELARALLARLGAARPRALLPAARGGRPELREALEAAGCPVTALELYESRPLPPPTAAELDVDAIVLASPSGARATLVAPTRARMVAIGPTTAAELEALGHEVAAVADSPDPAAVLAALARALRV
ncbi:MAG: hydroxymethylbilane synthase [Planctomycetota bacterium]